MAVMEVRNDNTGWLIMWLEPLGEDRWLAPGEVFQVRSDYTGDDQAFSITCWVNDEDRAAGIENIAVWIDNGDCYAQVTDRAGNTIECGHRRPEEINRKWAAAAEEAHRLMQEREAKRNSCDKTSSIRKRSTRP
ncbi:hypothetical protein ACIBHY_31670 [Nonomuraea sp. NPDC050547]|uniref:hypothetical protein n=1 Tax=unclassified Nonomuraea TaxID=2593643 RepID=UPI0037900F9E